MNSLENTISISDLKARCDEILKHLTPSGIVITRRGRPVARITPLATVNNEPLIGSMKGQITINGDLLSTETRWDAQS